MAVCSRCRGGDRRDRPQLPWRRIARRCRSVQQMNLVDLATHPEDRATAPAAAILEVTDLVTHFPVRNGTVKAVDGVSFTLQRGKTLCMVGESGSGQSVTARSILQIVDAPGRIVSGSVVLHRGDGTSVDLAKLDPRGREIRAVRGREIAMIFQE